MVFITTWRAQALFAALALYGLLSAPAPPAVRLVEAAIGALLVVCVGIERPLMAATGHALRSTALPPWESVGTAAFVWLLWAPLVRGLTLGWEPEAIVRDVVPLVYLFLPVLLVPLLRCAGPQAVPLLATGLTLAGVLFVLRWWRHTEWGFDTVGARAMGDGTRYFLNAPSVLFAAVVLPMTSLSLMARGGWWRWVLAFALLVPAALCLGALAGAVHRMALGVMLLAFLATVPWWWRRAPWALAWAAVLAASGAALFSDVALGALELVAEKNRLTGASARVEEAMAVLEQAGRSLPALLFGDGWGALIANPAVGGWRVAYTHTLLSYALLKAGVLGVLALTAYLAGLVPGALALLRANPPLAAAVLAPLSVALSAHTSFKYLDCGLLLTLMVLAAEKAEHKG
ncbi:MAG TPA: hypothetical protein VD978_23070 [Azospirillum sp.]|nr:hypothetical protein [Azospirillum sp.]